MIDETQALRAALRADAVIETHLSRILLAGDWAYKLKKPIRLPFADFRSIEARRHYCEEELRLNRRLAPALYVDVLPLLGSAQAPRLGQPGEGGDESQAIDWVLRMRRFCVGSELDALVRTNRLDPAQLDGFAARIARLHAEAHSSKQIQTSRQRRMRLTRGNVTRLTKWRRAITHPNVQGRCVHARQLQAHAPNQSDAASLRGGGSRR